MALLRKNLVKAVRSRVSEARLDPHGGEAGNVVFVSLPRLHRAMSNAEFSIDLLASPGLGEYRAIVVRNLAPDNDWEMRLNPWIQCLERGGYLLSIDRPSHKRAQEVCRKLLCLGLSDIRQEIAGRRILTSGRCIAKLELGSEALRSDSVI